MAYENLYSICAIFLPTYLGFLFFYFFYSYVHTMFGSFLPTYLLKNVFLKVLYGTTLQNHP
jgi:hypothetical protein